MWIVEVRRPALHFERTTRHYGPFIFKSRAQRFADRQVGPYVLTHIISLSRKATV